MLMLMLMLVIVIVIVIELRLRDQRLISVKPWAAYFGGFVCALVNTIRWLGPVIAQGSIVDRSLAE